MPAAAEPSKLMVRLNRDRIVIADVVPQLDAGRYPIKRLVGDTVTVQATIFREGTAILRAVVKYRREEDTSWCEVPMTCINPGLSRWSGTFPVEHVGVYVYNIEAWTDRFATWQRDLAKKAGLIHTPADPHAPAATTAAPPDLTNELKEGVARLKWTLKYASASAQPTIQAAMDGMLQAPTQEAAVQVAVAEELGQVVTAADPRKDAEWFERMLRVTVDPVLAGCGAWYELFPRSQSPEPGRHGTLRDVIRRLPELAELGFDVLYLPPIHPIGRSHRKGKNNAPTAGPDDVGSPWAIGNEHGGHDAIEPALGTFSDFDALIAAAREHGIAIALDFAIQCSPDHPYVQQHPTWFRRRADGSIQYAENPPKKYQDIYPLDFESADWAAMWQEWRRVLELWIAHGVRIFRVDNPHTKPVGFWEWLIGEIKQAHPDVVFLSEAFTAPPMMQNLAKLGFSQSYTYFTWRNTKNELTEYLTELTQTEVAEYFRPNFFANTPDILHEYLQKGGKPAFQVRLVLAATLSPSYGIYSGFEFYENQPVRPGSEEYLNSEKYELKHRNEAAPDTLKPMIRTLNQLRRQHAALQRLRGLTFHTTTNPNLLCYSRSTPDGSDRVLVVVNLDPKSPHDGMVELDLPALGLEPNASYYVHDKLSGDVWPWQGARNYVRLDPARQVAHVFVIERPNLNLLAETAPTAIA
jgi:starch synthase (maltosyl-transferring)